MTDETDGRHGLSGTIAASDEYPENRCRSCGAFVTRDFVRVFGTNENEVHGCMECLSATAMKNGRARPDEPAKMTDD